MTSLTIVRHGQTDWNRELRYQGSSDILVSSPLKRAWSTALILGNHLGLDPLADNRFRERCVGAYEGLTAAEARERFPHAWQANCTRQIFYAPPGGESVMDVAVRVKEGLDFLYAGYKNKKILLVAHGFVTRTIAGLVNRLSDEEFYEFRLDNGDRVSFELD